MVIGNACGTGFRVEPIGKGITERVNTTAWPSARLDHGDVMTSLGQLVRRRQPG